ncbi:MAG: hypothetical protein RLZZ152_1376, partial [Pseudomonadota bacterium]
RGRRNHRQQAVTSEGAKDGSGVRQPGDVGEKVAISAVNHLAHIYAAICCRT